ncbi:putative polygalacturonase [Lupinus albus]|uniref:Putative polygalacturonase n=1 Tax=Lupinus albus TaxID=3870 RepID=A0A6A4QC36_LUPAL|nr:putative polygalacturonase [Lupinus albus]
MIRTTTNVKGGSGYVRNITFENIKLIQADNSIIIDQHYGTKNPNNEAVSLEISDVIFKGFEGTSANEKAIRLNCSSNGCFNIRLEDINIVSSKPNKKAKASCQNAHGIVQNVTPHVSCMLQ